MVLRELPTGTVTLVFTDIEGSTRLLQELGNHYGEVLREHRRLLREAFQRHGGVEVDMQGDAFFFAFSKATDAAVAAQEGQAALAAGKIRVRMGLHTGEPLLTDEGYIGVDVHRASRICSAAHGGQVLLSEATARLIEGDLRDLGRHRVKDLDAPQHFFQLGQEDFPPLRTRAPAERTNLPVESTTFIGRAAEVDEVKGLLRGTRMVTLTGAGGIGKTRLALTVAAELVDAFPDGVWLIELASLTDPDLVPQTVISALGFSSQAGGNPIDTLINRLAPCELLCVLDNCEHLVDACAGLVDGLLRRCSRLRILATSREVLGIDAESVWRVPSLAVPADPAGNSIEALQRVESVELFCRRADAVCSTHFVLNDENAQHVARICNRLDGLPLAIELAAARTRALSVAAIDERLDRRFQLLGGGRRSSMPRHRTLQATLDWSHDLLTDEERHVFRRLSVFLGGFQLEAADAVCDDSSSGSAPRLGALETITRLVDKSLVAWDDGRGPSGRYRMLETVRQYGEHQLSEAGEVDSARRAHTRFYLDLGDQAHQGLRGQLQPAWSERLNEELDNFRACFEWALSHEPSAALRLACSLERHWIGDDPAEGLRWTVRALSAAPEQTELRAQALYNASFWSAYAGQHDEALRFGEECRAVAQQVGSSLYAGQALGALAFATYQEQRPGWQAAALRLLEKAEGEVRDTGNDEALARLLNNHGCTLVEAGSLSPGRVKLEEALALARGLGDDWFACAVLEGLAACERAQGDTKAAVTLHREGLVLAERVRNRAALSFHLIGLARINSLERPPEWWLRQLGAATAQLERDGRLPNPAEQQDISARREVAERLLGRDAATAFWEEGTRMSAAEAVSNALQGDSPVGATPSRRAAVGEAGAPPEAEFVRTGEFWSLTFMGTTVRLRDSKGLRDIARLMATPGREVAAVDLTSGWGGGKPVPGRHVAELGMGVEADAGETLDGPARSQYRARLTDLEEEIDDADSANDPERAVRAREEREFLLAELSAAVGLSGRPRRALDPAERARKAVTWRIREALNHVEASHAELGRHLRRSVRTGGFCVYQPTEPTNWRL